MRKYASEFPIRKMAQVLHVSCSGYYKHRNKKDSKTIIKNRELLVKIKIIYNKNRQIYGSPRIHAVLKKQGESCSRKKIAKLMQINKIQAKTRKKWKTTTKGTKDLTKISPNLLNQNFKVNCANVAWVGDITYIYTSEGWLYVSTFLDLYSRKIVGLSTGNCLDTDLVIRSLNQAINRRRPGPGLILHSDRGVQYTSNEYKKIAGENRFVLSMSAKGNCYDNAAMETFFHTLKTEHVFFYNYKTRNEAIASIFEYIEVFYNRQRIHSTLNYMTPIEYEELATVSC